METAFVAEVMDFKINFSSSLHVSHFMLDVILRIADFLGRQRQNQVRLG